jgi:hypothetical protein
MCLFFLGSRFDKGQNLYPRRRWFEEVTRVFAAQGRVVPVFNDKHLGGRQLDGRYRPEDEDPADARAVLAAGAPQPDLPLRAAPAAGRRLGGTLPDLPEAEARAARFPGEPPGRAVRFLEPVAGRVGDLKPGTHVKGTTVAELGNRNRPLDMVILQGNLA